MSSSGDIRSSYHGLVRRDVWPLIPDDAGVVLDVGGGVGATGGTLKAEGRARRVVLVDLVADRPHELVDAAVAGDLEDQALLDRVAKDFGPFNTILCLDVLEHLRDPWSVVARLHKMLAPEGVIVASLPNARHLEFVVPLVVHGRFELKDAGIMDRTHLRWFTRQSAIELMTGSGLHLDQVIDKLPIGRRYKLVIALSFGLLRRFLDLQYLIRVRRVD